MVAAEREEPAGALHGIRVLDVAKPLGSYVSRILGDLGADVIKIEPPQGDPSRRVALFVTRDPSCRHPCWCRALARPRAFLHSDAPGLG